MQKKGTITKPAAKDSNKKEKGKEMEYEMKRIENRTNMLRNATISQSRKMQDLRLQELDKYFDINPVKRQQCHYSPFRQSNDIFTL